MQKLILISTLIVASLSAGVNANPRQSILAELSVLAKAQDASFSEFDSKRGEELFASNFALGKPETPSCTTCHSNSPKNAGETRAGKTIEPMAVSISSERYSDPKKVEKWFRRNCNSVLGRECTPLEKGDFLTFMANQ